MAHSVGMEHKMLKDFYNDKAEAEIIGAKLMEYVEAKHLGTVE
jgi:hypothetical protein